LASLLFLVSPAVPVVSLAAVGPAVDVFIPLLFRSWRFCYGLPLLKSLLLLVFPKFLLLLASLLLLVYLQLLMILLLLSPYSCFSYKNI
jgi:hypothetical protein